MKSLANRVIAALLLVLGIWAFNRYLDPLAALDMANAGWLCR